jgi:hypothetical protein
MLLVSSVVITCLRQRRLPCGIPLLRSAEAKSADTFEFRNLIKQVKAIDLAMCHYVGTEPWMTIRVRLFPKNFEMEACLRTWGAKYVLIKCN